MNREATEAAERWRATAHEVAYWEAGARSSSHDDVVAVLHLWTQHPARRTAIRRDWPQLAKTLDALMNGWNW